ncbi:MAG TPA: molybdenum cofactor biosynthesis protein MoaE [Chthoniobacterales bacterium]|nr:molybdenum cofactor biosynthesis protein MoaE [Chthoniobacterales bacterium]
MAISVCEVSLTKTTLDLPARENDPAAGAIVDFWGVVRGLENGREITGIEYEAHPAMAEHQMKAIAETASGKFGLTNVVIRHRIGFVPAGEASIVVRVESGHRLSAFTANPWIMDELKRTVPIWKHPIFKDETASATAEAQNRPGNPSEAVA